MTAIAPFRREVELFKGHGGFLRTSQALKLGVHPRALYRMRKEKIIEPISRGLFRLSQIPPPAKPDIAAVALKIPQGILCLISALAFHEITTQIPHEIFVALRKGSEKPRLNYPPVRFVWLSKATFEAGIETYKAKGFNIRVYCPEKTVADCFKFRNRIGLDVALEALKLYRARKRPKPDKIG